MKTLHHVGCGIGAGKCTCGGIQIAEPESETCPMCDDTGFELSSDPEAFCTLCARGLGVASRNPAQPESTGEGQ